MPILEYVCKECSHHFETLVQGSQKPIACPSCQSADLERLLSMFAVGGRSAALAAAEPLGPCGACGDPRGPGACAMGE
jgi:putative FmdB family regulatory protein